MDPLQKLAAIGREAVKSLVPNPAEPASNQHMLLQQQAQVAPVYTK